MKSENSEKEIEMDCGLVSEIKYVAEKIGFQNFETLQNIV
jgi:hypothetical protein